MIASSKSSPFCFPKFRFPKISLEFVILLLALLLRVCYLTLKPVHFDEGINGWFVDQLFHLGYYPYDPTNYHGPLYFYLLFLSERLFGVGVVALRLPAVLGSFFAVFIALRLAPFFGKKVARWGALLLAISPGFLFYGRYSIHESWLMASTMLFFLGILGCWKNPSKKTLSLAFLGATLMLLLKETAVIHLVVALLSVVFLRLWEQFSPSREKFFNEHEGDTENDFGYSGEEKIEDQKHFQGTLSGNWSWSDRSTLFFSVGLFALAVLTLFFFYSGTFLAPDRLGSLINSLPAWMKTGAGHGGHVKSDYQCGIINYYWIALMFRYEWPLLLGLCYGVRLLWPSPRFLRYLAINLLGVLIIYSAIPYKTPWCLISIIWPAAFLMGALIEELFLFSQRRGWRVPLGGVVLLFLLSSLFLSVRLNFFRETDPQEPYVYVQTSAQIDRLLRPLQQMVAHDPRFLNSSGIILLKSYYPLPWLLRDFPHLTYPSTIPTVCDADFVVIEASRASQLEEHLQGWSNDPTKSRYTREQFELRDAMEPCYFYLKKS